MKKRLRIFIFAFTVFLALAIVYSIFYIFKNRMSMEELAIYIRSFGMLAPLSIFGLQFIDLLYPFVPGLILTIATGYIFGFWYGFLIVTASTLFAHGVLFLITKLIGRTIMERLIKHRTLYAIDCFLKDRSRLMLLIARLVFILPYNIVTMAAGLTDMSLLDFLIATFLGTLPYLIIFPYIGSVMAGRPISWTFVSIFSILLITVIIYTLKRYWHDLKAIHKNSRMHQ